MKDKLPDYACYAITALFVIIAGRAVVDLLAYGRYGPTASVIAVAFGWVVLTVWAKMEEENL